MPSGGDQKKNKEQKLQLMKALYESQYAPSKFAKTFLDEEVFPHNSGFVDSKDRLIIYRAGRKTGKTYSTAIKALHAAFYAWNIQPVAKKEGYCEILIVAPTLTQAGIILDIIKNFIHKNRVLEQFMVKETVFQLEVIWFNGQGRTKIMTRASGDEGRSIRGYRPHIIIVDEAAFVPRDVFVVLMGAGIATRVHVWIISTPFGKVGYFWEKSSQARPNNPEGRWVEYHAKSTDNPYITEDPETLEEFRTMTADQAIQELEGEFADLADTLISNELIVKAVSSWKNPPEGSRYFVSVDVAHKGRDETVYTVGAVDDHDNLYIVEATSEPQSSYVDIVEKLAELFRKYKADLIFCDATAIGSAVVELAERRGLPVRGITFTMQSKSKMYNTLRLLFEEGRIRIRGIQRLAFQLSYLRRSFYENSMLTKVVSDAPDHQDDFCDSCVLLTNAVSNMDNWGVFKDDAGVFGR